MEKSKLTIKRTYDAGHTQLRLIDKDDDLLGYANFGMADVGIGKIAYFEIAEHYRAQGLARQLLSAVLADLRCKGAEKVILSASDQKMLIWKELGFVEKEWREMTANMEKDISDLSPDCPMPFEQDKRPARSFKR